MDIVLLCKFVPDIDRVPDDAWDRERGTLIRSRLEMSFNPLDRVALRMALRIQAARPDTKIVALTMGPPSAATMLKEAIAYGANSGLLLTDKQFAGADTIATAYALSAAIRSMVAHNVISADFAVLCGMQSPDGDTAQVPAQVASFLDAPLYPYASDLNVDGGTLEFKCLNSVGYQIARTGLTPFVVTATRLYPDMPFYVDLESMQRANETPIQTWSAGDIEIDIRRIGLEGSRTRVIKIFEPPRKHHASELLSVEREDFDARADELLNALKLSLTSRERETEHQAQRTGTGGGYYAGDCAALCELDERRLAPVSFEIASACANMAKATGSRSIAIVPFEHNAAFAEQLREYGIEAVHFITGLDADVFRVRERALAIAALVRTLQPQMVIAPATLTGRVLAPYVSTMLDCGLTADCSALEVKDCDRKGEMLRNILYQTRPALGGNIMATIVSVYDDPACGRPQMATVRPGALNARRSPAAHCEIKTFIAPFTADASDSIRLERRAEDEKRIDLADYEVIVCVGLGVGDRKAINEIVEPFRSALERFIGVPVGLGCSRAVVDAGILPHSHQIGQTGIVVKPRIYIGIGVSGAVQHKIGMENSRMIVSINRDPSAPMHGFADYAVVGEIRRVLPRITRLLG